MQTQTQTAASFRGGKARKKVLKIGGRAADYLLLVLFSLFFLFPFIVMINLSFMTNKEVNMQVLFSPSGTLYLGAYLDVLTGEASRFLLGLRNTLFVAAITTVGIPLVSSLCAYGFAKMEFVGKEIVFGTVLATMMIPSVISLVPLYTLYAKFGWINTLLPMWLPSLFGGGATNIFLMRQFMRGIPNDMVKAAELDGANSFVVYVRIMIPLCLPILLYVAVQSFMGAWNDFMTPFTYINTTDSKAIPLAYAMYLDYGPGNKNAQANEIMAAGVLMTLPCVALFFCFQKYLVEGVAITGMKD